MDFRLGSMAEFARLKPAEVIETHLDYMAEALRLLRQELGHDKALLGFAGCPWTLASYMVEGGSGTDLSRLPALRREQPELFQRLMERLSEAVIRLCRMQFAAGADAVQLFDSLGASCAPEDYEACSLQWTRRVIDGLKAYGPVIFYAKGVAEQGARLLSTGATALSLDWTVSLADFCAEVPGDYAIQGNLDPAILTTTPEATREATRQILDSMAGRPGHIFNLGHGITPQAHLACVEALVQTVVEYEGPDH